jgi:ATP-dependent protease HslVU (ClpYQ) peptidase subunit
MTIIAWDGKTLAADKRGTVAGMGYAVTKIHRLPDGLVAFSGGGAHAAELLNWFHGSRNPDTYPRRDDDSGAGALHIDAQGRVFMYSAANPFPERIESPYFARGSGRDYAMAAMHLGCDARRAVEVACAFDIGCGHGIDTLELK